MNKTYKIILSILGGFEVAFNIFIPYSIASLIVIIIPLDIVLKSIVLISGSLSSLYRAIDVAGFDTLEYLFKKIFKKK